MATFFLYMGLRKILRILCQACFFQIKLISVVFPVLAAQRNRTDIVDA